jgi:hypothetical protein
MKKMYLMKGMALLAMGLVAASCNRMEFAGQPQISDEEALTNAELKLGVSIDPKQDWNMTQNVTTKVSLNMGTGKDYTVYVFNDSPFDSDDAVYYSMNTVTDGASMRQTITVPKGQEMLYISVFDSDGSSVSKRIFLSGDEVDVSFGDGTTRAARRAMRRGNSANGNMWADIKGKDGVGGWLVPDPLTDSQKERVKAYFQHNPGGEYVNPGWENFFIQQVYTGGIDPLEGGSPEVITAADGSKYTSASMNELAVGKNHVDCGDFEKADASVYENVLDNGSDIDAGKTSYHPDQIELMVDIDDMSCFSYKGIGGYWHDDKAVLVDANVIDEWAEKQNPVPGAKVVDKWNRSFMGFDHELKDKQYIFQNNKYVKLSDLQNAQPTGTPQYIWDGEKVWKIGKAPASIKKRAKAKRAAEVGTKINLLGYWNNYYGNNVSNTYENGIRTFTGDAWAGLQAYNFGNINEGHSYTKFVLEFAEKTTIGATLQINTNGTPINTPMNAGTSKVEIDLTEKTTTEINSGSIQIWEKGTIKIKSMYVVVGPVPEPEEPEVPSGSEDDAEFGGYIDTEYVLIDGEKIPFCFNPNEFIGEKLTGDDTVVNDNNKKIKKKINGQEVVCVNLPVFREAFKAGYYPKDDNLREWYKYTGSDNYYSDWIVTLCKAKRVGEEEINIIPPVITPAIYSYAFEDTKNGDYDMNDVVLKVQRNSDDATKIDVWLVAAGATLDLKINLYQYDETKADKNYYGAFVKTLTYKGKEEIHEMWSIDAGTMVNTGAGANTAPIRIDQLSIADYDPAKLRFSIISDSQGEIFLAGSGQAPFGVIIPMDWQWPKERVRVTTAYNQENASDQDEANKDQSFKKFAAEAGKAELWYKYPTGSVMIKAFDE